MGLQPAAKIPWDCAATIWFESEARGGVDAGSSPTTGNEAIGPNPGCPKDCGALGNSFGTVPLRCPASLSPLVRALSSGGACSATCAMITAGLLVSRVMAKIKSARPKKTGTPPVRGGLPCVILVIVLMVLVMIFLYLVMSHAS